MRQSGKFPPPQQCGAVRGGDDVVSRVRVAAAACLMASGLFVGGAGGALAFAAPDETDGPGGAGTTGDSVSDDTPGATGQAPAESGGTPRPDRRDGRPHVPRVVIGHGRDTAPPDLGKSAEEDDLSKQSEASNGQPSPGSTAGAGEQHTAVGASPWVTAQTSLGSTLPSTVADPPVPGGDPDDPDDPDNPEDPDDPDDCDDGSGHQHCLPWWWPKPGLSSSGNGHGGIGSGAPKPTRRVPRPPVMQLPAPPAALAPDGEVPVVPTIPDIVNPAPGLASAIAALPLPPVSVPQIVVPPGAGGGGAAGAGSGAAPPAAPRAPSAPRSPREPPRSPVQSVDNPVVPASYRVGYGEYLRTAGISQVVAVAVPGATGIMLLTGAGGIIGYRQARAALALRSGRSARFTS